MESFKTLREAVDHLPSKKYICIQQFQYNFGPISGQRNGAQIEKYSPLDEWLKKCTFMLGYYIYLSAVLLMS